MHDLILRNRVAGYREGDLMRHLHGDGALRPAAERSAFEHHHPETGILVAFPVEAWPHLLAAMRARTRRHGAWSGKLTTRETALATHILEEIKSRGPLCSADKWLLPLQIIGVLYLLAALCWLVINPRRKLSG